MIVPITFAAIFFLLFMLFNSVKLATLIFTALPFASVGGVIGLFITGEYLSVPASVGFIAVWGVSNIERRGIDFLYQGTARAGAKRERGGKTRVARRVSVRC